MWREALGTRDPRSALLLGGALLAILWGCASPGTMAYRSAIRSEYGKQAGFSPGDSRWIEQHCPLGMPKHLAGVDFGNTRVICREGYVLEHSAKDKIPLWVCERVTRAQLSGPLHRPEPGPFAPDPKLERGRRSERSDYSLSGYDLGHQAPSGDQTVRQDLQAETFFLSNMAPQRAALNRRIWRVLEMRVRDLAMAKGEVYTITGGLFYEEAEENPATADGYVEYRLIGTGVAVPTHFYKIVSWRDDRGRWQAAGFVFKNQEREFAKPYRFDDYAREVKWIERAAGLNFMPDLPGPDSKRVEGARTPMWN